MMLLHLHRQPVERGSRHRHRSDGTVRHAAQVDGQASRLSSSGGSGWGLTTPAAAARLGAQPGGSGEDDMDTGAGGAHDGPTPAAVVAVDVELSQLKQDSAPITPLGLSGGEYIRAAACLRLFPALAPTSQTRKLMAVTSEMILAHSAVSSCDASSGW